MPPVDAITKISDIGKIYNEVESFKSSCQTRAAQAAEFAQNVDSDCVQPLSDLIAKQRKQFNDISLSAKRKMD